MRMKQTIHNSDASIVEDSPNNDDRGKNCCNAIEPDHIEDDLDEILAKNDECCIDIVEEIGQDRSSDSQTRRKINKGVKF